MSTLDLRNIIIHKISEINDVSFLEALKTIVESKTESSVLPLTNEQQTEILKSKEEIENGLFVDNGQVELEISKWLKEK
jgi:hypothetical protein